MQLGLAEAGEGGSGAVGGSVAGGQLQPVARQVGVQRQDTHQIPLVLPGNKCISVPVSKPKLRVCPINMRKKVPVLFQQFFIF